MKMILLPGFSPHKCRFPELVDDSPGTAKVSYHSEGFQIEPCGISAAHPGTIEILVRYSDGTKSELDRILYMDQCFCKTVGRARHTLVFRVPFPDSRPAETFSWQSTPTDESPAPVASKWQRGDRGS
jgi:hypothetical protein